MNLEHKILVLSKNAEHKKIIQDSIIETDIEIKFCGNFDKALKLLDTDTYSMIIFRYKKTKKKNLLYIKKFRERPLFLNKPILSIVDDDNNYTKLEHIDDYIFKAFNKNEIKNKILTTIEEYYSESLLIDKIFAQKREHTDKVSKIKQKHEKEISIIKDRMLLIFTHELKTPLNAIISFSDYLNRGLQGGLNRKRIERFTELAEIIKINGEVLLSEINTLLDIAKIKDNRMVFNLETISLNELIEESVYKYKLLYKKQVITSIDEVFIQGDSKAFLHIYENIFSNALKYSCSMVKTTLKKDEENFTFTIEDDGDGIPEDQREKIFDIFEQSEKTVLTREKEGTGIGLYIVKLLCEEFNYNITIDDSPLGGAKFIITGKIRS